MNTDFIPITRPNLDKEEWEAIRQPIESGWVTQGPQVSAFESEFARAVGASYGCAVSSCTTALHLALRAVGVGKGDHVVTASHSYIATANSIHYCGALPLFVDIDPETYNIDPLAVEEAITDKTKAILVVHQMGMPCDIKRLLKVAKKHRLAIVEDAACAAGSEIRIQGTWKRIGLPHGDIACFSFHPRKVITTGDGGMLTTANQEWDRKFRLWRQHSMDISDKERHGAKKVTFESYPEIGFNYRMTDIQAAIGRVQLGRLPTIVSSRRTLAKRYHELLGEIPEVSAPHEPTWARSNWQSYCIRLAPDLEQRQIMQSMLDEGVATRRGIMCSHREPAYRREDWICPIIKSTCACASGKCRGLRHSEEAQDHSILLPLYPGMKATQQDRVVENLKNAIACAH